MPGLLDSLGSLLDSSGLSGSVAEQGSNLGAVVSTVQSLIDGPPDLSSLQGLIDAVPMPPGLEGIGTLATHLDGFSAPTDFAGALAPVLAPLTNLAGTITGGGASQAGALFDMVREIIRLISGRAFGGPSGMPEEGRIQIPDLPDPDELRNAITQARAIVQDIGPRLDAARLLEYLQGAATGFGTPLFRFPNLPVIDETMEALQTVAAWQTMTPNQLNANLARTVEMAAELIRMPRTRVAQPVLDAAGQIADGSTTLSDAQTTLTEVFVSLRPKVLTGNAHPTFGELRRIETAAERLAKLASALHPQKSPLARASGVDEALIRSLLAVARALQPAYDIAPIAEKGRQLLGNLPETTEDLFQDVIDAIDEFDLSAVTSALQTVRNSVQDVVGEVEGALATVRAELENLLFPVESALDTALTAAGFTQIQSALESLPGEIESFVNDQVMPVVEPIRQGIETAVNAISTASAGFNPEALIAPIRQAVDQVSQLLNSDAVRSAFEEVNSVLGGVIQALENLNLTAAADESISLIGDIETTVEGIDPALIPDAAKPMIEQAVTVVTDIDFAGEVAEPIANALETALVEGVGRVLELLEEGVDQLRESLMGFKPSKIIGDELDGPFKELAETLKRFQPSDLLGQLQETLNGLASRVNILDVGAVVDPLVEIHSRVAGQVEALRPSVLLQPVDDAIESAIEKVYEVTGVDTLFDGINDALDFINSWTSLLADARDLLQDCAGLFSEPGDASAAVDELVTQAVAKLDDVDLGRLQAAFSSAGEAVQSIGRDAIAGALARAMQEAGRQGRELLGSSAARDLATLIRSFPLDVLRRHKQIPVRHRLLEAMERLNQVADTLDNARQPWEEISGQLDRSAGELQEKLLDYYKVQQLNGGGVFAQFRDPPATVDALKETVRQALEDSLKEPLTTIVVAFQTFSPYIRLLAEGVGAMAGALYAKVDSITGEDGVSGTVDAIEEAANLLRNIDLSLVTGPLDDLYGRIETAVGALNPEPLRAILETARDAVGDLLRLSTLIDQDTIDTLDETYANIVKSIEGLAPSRIVSSTLDPEYEELLADFLPVLDLPARLRELLDTAGRAIGADAVAELARVEVAFDNMLRAIPLATGGQSAQASVSASVG